MNTSLSVANGGKLDDCHSSIYSLAVLTGLQWKTFSGQRALPVSPSDDPILGAFSNCLAQDILAVWRRAPNVKKSTPSITNPHNLVFNDDELNATSHFEHKKELWIFWWGNEIEPAIEGVGRTAGLSEDSEGSWEDVGLSYECRTLLFKAIHNLIERCLLSENFVRIGKWFLRPYRKEAQEERRDRLSLSFSFFLRGENTVCATVDIAQHQAVERVGNQFLSRAANNLASRTVILSPYGLRAAFTGLVYKSPHDQAVKTVIDEWKGFYPINIIQEQMNNDNDNADLPVPPVIEVFLSGVRMNYPSAYVLISVDMQSAQKEYENHTWNTDKRGLDCASHHGDITSIGSFQDSMGQSMNDMANSPVSETTRDFSPSMREDSGGSLVKKLISRVVNASQMSDTSNNFEMNGVHPHVGDSNNVSHDSAWPKISCQFKEARQQKNHMPLSDEEMIFSGVKQKHDNVAGMDAKRQKADKQKQATIIPFHRRNAEMQSSQRTQKNTTSSIPTHENNHMMIMYQPQSVGYQQWNQEEMPKPMDQQVGCDTMYFSNNIDMPQVPVSESFQSDTDMVPHLQYGISDEAIANTQIGEIKQHISVWKKIKLPKNEQTGAVRKSKIQKPSLIPGSLETECNSDSIGMKRSKTVVSGVLPWTTGSNKRKYKEVETEIDKVPEDNSIEALFWNDNNMTSDQAISQRFHVGEVTGELAGMAVRLDPYAFEDEDKDTDNTATFNPPRTTEISLKQQTMWPGNTMSGNFIDQKPSHPESFLQTNSVFSRGLSGFDSNNMEKPIMSSLTKEMDLKVSPNDLDNMFDDGDTGVSAADDFDLSVVKSNSSTMEMRGVYPPSQNDTFLQTFKKVGLPKGSNMNINVSNISNNRYGSNNGVSMSVESLGTLAKKMAGGNRGLGHSYTQNERRTDLSEVYSVDPLSKQPLTDKYAPILLKNKAEYGNGRMPPVFNYTPSWQMSVDSYAPQNVIPNSMDTHEDLSFMQSNDAPTPVSHSYSVKTPSSVPQQSPLPQQTPRTPRGNASPATSTPNPASHGRFAMHTPQTSVSSSVAQSDIGNRRASSIYVNLMLSDSVLNLFRDISFDQCPMCVCNENIRSRDVDLGYLPSMADNSSDGQYSCQCGFSAVRNRCLSVGTGLFLEDELEIVGKDLEAEIIKSRDAARKPDDGASEAIINFAVRQAPNPYLKINVTGNINMKCQVYNIACQQDIREACMEAINGGITVMETGNQPKIQVHHCKNVIHNWIDTRMLKNISSVDLYQMLQFLKPLLQNAIQRSRTERHFNFIQRVIGPLTWREFCKDNTGALEPLPVPMLLVGQSHDWTTVSPFALDYWEKLYLEPYAGITNISYLVICPEIEHVLAAAKFFFSELNSLYDLCRLGIHKPLMRNLPDNGIICIRGSSQKTQAESTNSEATPLSNHISSNIMKSVDAYVTACRDVLFPLFNIPMPANLPKTEPDLQSHGSMPNSTGKPGSMSSSTLPPKLKQGKEILQAQLASRHNFNDNATILLYFIDPFIGADSSAFSIAIWKCYSEIAKTLPEAKRNSVVIQIVPLEDILQYAGANDKSIVSTARSLAFSSYFQCRHRISHQAAVRTMTAFGPATTKNQAAQDNKLKLALPIHSPAYVLAGSKNSQKDSFSLEKRGIECNILYVTYCLSHDQKWIIASATDQDGEMLETFCVNIDVPPRRVSLKRKQRICVKAAAIEKLWKLCLSLITGTASMHWRIVIGRLGKLGHGEIQEWAKHLNRRNFTVLAKQVATKCTQCMLNGTFKHASIFSACLTSLEPEGSFTILPDLVKLAPFGRTANSGAQVQLKTPEDTSCTHIYVFPTSSLVQTAAGGTFQNENLDFDLSFSGLGEQDENLIELDDLFQSTSPGGNNHQMDDIGHAKPQQDRLASTDIQEDIALQQQPLALGYLVSTAPTGPLPDFFWVPCPEAQFRCPVFLRFALHIQVSSDEVQNMGGADTNDQHHQLDSHKTAQVLRYVMENYNALSWLTCDPVSRDRRSCLPIHYFVLTRLYHTIKELT